MAAIGPESCRHGSRVSLGAFAFIFFSACAVAVTSADVIEFLSGAKVTGSVTGIDKEKKEVTINAEIGGISRTRTYPYSKIHAVTLGEKRYELNPKRAETTRPTKPDGTDNSATGGDRPKTASGNLSSRDLQKLIDDVGRTPPEWFDATPLNYPDTLDLTWPKKPPGGWNAQKNIGQFIWDIVNPNENRWREGVKFMHHMLSLSANNPELKRRVMNELGRMYHDLLEDYARAAFWWQQAGVDEGETPGRSGPNLASCYYKLGSKSMALALLKKLPGQYLKIKVLGEMGETQEAIKLAEAYAKANNGRPDIAYMYAGDACRTAGDYQKALAFYQKVLATPGDEKKSKQFKDRARASIEGIKHFELSDVRRVADGSYSASAPGYTGPVEVKVVVTGGVIESVDVTRHSEKQFYSAISDTTTKILVKQGVKGVDATSSATITSEAIINATAKALASGAK